MGTVHTKGAMVIVCCQYPKSGQHLHKEAEAERVAGNTLIGIFGLGEKGRPVEILQQTMSQNLGDFYRFLNYSWY